jgi:predicted DCC family thiol-disulfide oxidoreductase YuxK
LASGPENATGWGVKQPPIIVAARLSRPLMIYDGDCGFCKFWIVRWQQTTAGAVDYIASQEPRVAEQFPELPRERLAAAVQLVETDGAVFEGADAVFRALAYNPRFRWPRWFYERVPGVAPVTEAAYALVARRRTFFSLLTRMLWGTDPTPPAQELVRWVFLRALGLIYLCAFLSLGTQIFGLIGHGGILPTSHLMETARIQLDQKGVSLARYWMLPTLCWVSAGDPFLRLLCGAGVAMSVLVVFDIAPAACLFLLWLVYLSLATVCGEFLGFQWDNLLLEIGLLAIFFAPPQPLPGIKRPGPPSRVVLWLLRWLLFRLMFESGLVKLVSGDESWSKLRALNFHYATQPLPTWIGWYAHQLPAGAQRGCVAFMFIIELAVPFLIFAPRRLRSVGCALLLLLQVVIFLTGNYCFFNLLTMALCVLMLDDRLLVKFLPAKWPGRILKGAPAAPTPEKKPPRGWPLWVTIPLAAVVLLLSVPQVFYTAGILRGNVFGYETLAGWAEPFRSVNGYGLFAVMTTRRLEIVVEGSNDRQHWLPYEFKYKPGDVMRRPGFVAPHQPRLDWQMWFAALGSYRENPWFVNFCVRLLQGSPDVIKLLEHDPFPDAPPRYIRAEVYEYHFTSFKERRETGAWWRREFVGEYLPVVSIRGN